MFRFVQRIKHNANSLSTLFLLIIYYLSFYVIVTILSLIKFPGEIIFGSCGILTCWWLFAVFAALERSVVDQRAKVAMCVSVILMSY
jgi:hypothetical protein